MSTIQEKPAVGRRESVLEISYNCRSDYSKTLSSGSTRIRKSELQEWIMRHVDKGPLIITEFKEFA